MTDHAKERRLYEIDEAAFGADRAPKLWQFSHSCGNPGLLVRRPSWQTGFKYERRPDAPPRPSDRWLDAPEWAQFLLTDGKVTHWLKNDPRKDAPAPQPGSTGIGIAGHELQERPLEAWFDLRRREKTSAGIPQRHRHGAEALQSIVAPMCYSNVDGWWENLEGCAAKDDPLVGPWAQMESADMVLHALADGDAIRVIKRCQLCRMILADSSEYHPHVACVLFNETGNADEVRRMIREVESYGFDKGYAAGMNESGYGG